MLCGANEKPRMKPASQRRRPGIIRMLGIEMVESFIMAMGAMASHKMRAALTLLGVTVGVFSIIMVMTAMRVLQNNIESELSFLGAHTFVLEKWPAFQFDGPSGWEKYRRRKNITLQQADDLRQRADLARNVGADTWLSRGEVFSKYDRTNPDVTMWGVTPAVFGAKNWVVQDGRSIMQADVEGARNVCVLGHTLMKRLFPIGSPLGENVNFNGIQYMVIGFLEAKGAIFGESQDNFMAIPISTGLNRYGGQWTTLSLYVQAHSAEAYADTVEQTRGIMRAIRKVAPADKDDFEVNSNDSLIQEFRSFTFAVRIGVAIISSIALLAAGIGIMNIMLVSVTERTREIGVRRAIGAKKRNIMTQFIMEAVVICEVGGAIGVALGIAGGNAAAYYFKAPPVIPVDWVLIGLGICSLVGIIFGTYPAFKAANLDPIESLRYE
jgi:putative ABC transport system permease protein